MPNKMLIDASHREETRVVVVRGNRIEEFDFESQDKKQLRGNIYLARVTRVEPSLQAAFVEYGGNRHGFLAFSEIHPDYYQIPVADRQALVQAEAEAAAEEEDSEEEGKSRRRRRAKTRGEGTKPESAANAEGANGESISEAGDDNGDNGDEDVEFVGAEDALEEVRNRRKPVRKNYKIQEVIKRRQIMLVQVVKEERGNKGAALTTYLSLAGRYSVLMPNTARGGGISRKITQPQDRKRLKEMVRDLEVPEGMGVILRTAGQNRTKAEIKRDYEYLMRLWETVRNQTLESIAPCLVYEEGSLIKRSVRDLYNKDISEIQVAGEEGYREAKSFMRMLMPSHAKVVQPYRDRIPIFAGNGIEAQLDKMLQPQVTLKSGGYVIINQTEALVAIDVNSGRSTREHSIEDTALQTNLEAAEEIARQLRLRDLAGLIVIDFIDMEENRNNRAVEKKLKECLKNDRARIQVGRISHFGLLEMSRQRIRASVLESTMQTCPHCGGAGHVRSESSVALLVIRAIEEYLLKDSRNNITVRTPASTALYVLNHKRANLIELEERFGPAISIEADDTVGAQHYAILKGGPAERIVIDTPKLEEMAEDDEPFEEFGPEAEISTQSTQEAESGDGEEGQRKRKRRRRRRGGRDRDREPAAEIRHVEEAVRDLEDGLPEPFEPEQRSDGEEPGHSAQGDDGDGKKRRRGRRGGRRNRREHEAAHKDEAPASEQDQALEAREEQPDFAAQEAIEQTSTQPVAEFLSGGLSAPPQERTEPAKAQKAKRPPRRKAKAQTADDQNEQEAVAEADAEAQVAEDAPKPKRKRAPSKKSEEPQLEQPAQPEPEVQEPVDVSAETEEAVEPQPRRSGWWQRRGLF